MNGILKEEYLSFVQINSLPHAHQVVQNAVALYNYKRPHMSCDMLVPSEAHQTYGKLKRRWKNTYRVKQESE